MKLIEFFLEKIGGINNEGICQFLPEDTEPGQVVVIKRENIDDVSGAYKVIDSTNSSDDSVIITEEII